MSELESVTLKLEAQGHRVTPSRRAVIAAVLQQSAHFTVDDLLRRCRGAGRATVFRTVRLLSDLGVVCRVLMEDGACIPAVARGHHHQKNARRGADLTRAVRSGPGGLVRVRDRRALAGVLGSVRRMHG
jgi:Fur family ferric uptake transcriptional regulator